jgi:hypothetical protein
MMQRILTAALFSTLVSVALSARAGQTAQSQEAKDKQPLVTVTGCLRSGEEPSTFVLSNVKWLNKGTAETKPPEATGTAGKDAPSSGATLRIVGSPSGVRMSEHVGHMVEITGTIIDEAGAQPSRPPAQLSNPQPMPPTSEQNPPPPSAQPTRPAPKAEHTVNVRTIRMIGESCTPGGLDPAANGVATSR